MSSHNISGLGQILQGHSQMASAAASHAAKGEWNGLAVVVRDDPSSLLADAAEEMSFAASEKVEKDVTERKKPERRQVAQVVPPAEALAEMQHRMAERLAKLLAAVKMAMGNPAAFRQAIGEFKDPAERHAALLWLEEKLADQPSLAAMAKRERETLEAESAPAIQSGYNINGVDANAVGGPAAGRDAYRRTILGHGDVTDTLEAILERHELKDFAGTVDFLMRAVGADLSAAHPSIDKAALESMNNDLYHLRALGNFTREFDADIGRLRESGGKPPLANAGLETVRILCRAKNERIVMLDPLKNALALEGRRDPVYDVRALTRTYRLAHSIPDKLFDDQDARRRLLDAGQRLLDAAIDLEEEVLGAEE